VFCPQCGVHAADDARFCRSCGATLNQPTSSVATAESPGAPAAETPRPGYLASNVGTLEPALGGSVVYAGFWRRFVAYFIDVIAVYIVSFVAGLIIGLILGAAQVNSDLISGAGALAGICIAILYYPVQESSAAQATLGKRALGLKVTTLDGQRIGFGRALGRFFAKILSSLILMVGYIMAAFTEKKQALHDMIAGTLVVRSS
jgi:uncharacterized RDD family membrane protein YckC